MTHIAVATRLSQQRHESQQLVTRSSSTIVIGAMYADVVALVGTIDTVPGAVDL